MHTALCTFDDKTRAREALDALERAGFARHDLHIEHRDGHAQREDANDQWDGLEREVAVDRGVLSNFGHFFASLLGRDNPSGRADTYARHVEGGRYVVVVDARDEAEAARARSLLQGLQAGELDVVHRPGHPPLRDIVGMRQGQQAGMVERSREPHEGLSNPSVAPGGERQRAMASNAVSPTTGPELRDPELDRAPGLRYADKDKPR